MSQDPQFEWNQPISFYGKVIDEYGRPVSGAVANFTWTDLSPSGSSQTAVFTDPSGSFSLVNRTGKRLSVDVSKSGYHSIPSERLRTFEYANPADGKFAPNSSTPIVFHLKAKGSTEPLVVMRGNLNVPGVGKRFNLPSDGTLLRVNLITGKKVEGVGHLEVRLVVDNPKADYANPYKWSYDISAPDGGVCVCTNELPLEAPSEGYAASVHFEMLTSSPNWSNKSQQQFFVKTVENSFGWLNFTAYASDSPFCIIESLLNPSGSMNLQLDRSKEIPAR